MAKRSNVYIGTELKLNISIEPIDSYTMSDYEFSVEVYCSPRKSVVINKSEALRVDDNNYIILIDTEVLGAGDLRCKITALIPDGDFNDQTRTEITVVDTGITIVKGT